MVGTLEKIKEYADKAHGDQRRRYSNDKYIVHPIRVMEICRQFSNDLSILSAALLHDVLEDTPITALELKKYLESVMSVDDAKKTLKLVVELTDVFVKKDYPSLNRAKRKAKETERLSQVSADAQTIKYADIIDNISDMVYEDADFAKFYVRECKTLLQKINKGNEELYHRALKAIDGSLKKLVPARL
jgi:(p)ppGpp synthase/HD superfamily hydrolase